MPKRALILALWFYTGWTLGGLLSYMAGVPDAVGPALGIVATVAAYLFPRLDLSRSARSAGRSEPVS